MKKQSKKKKKKDKWLSIKTDDIKKINKPKPIMKKYICEVCTPQHCKLKTSSTPFRCIGIPIFGDLKAKWIRYCSCDWDSIWRQRNHGTKCEQCGRIIHLQY